MGRLAIGLIVLANIFSTALGQSDWADPWISPPPESSSAFLYVRVDAVKSQMDISEFIEVDRNITAVINYIGDTAPIMERNPTFDFVTSTKNPGTGYLILKRNLDYEVVDSRLVVLAFYFPGVVKFQTLTVNVMNENDNTPVIRNYLPSITFPENQPGEVARFRATDADEGDEAQLQYTLTVLAGTANRFKLVTQSESGKNIAVLQVEGTLDYEVETFYLLEITVADRTADAADRLSSSVQVTLRVEDRGDEPPRWKTLTPVKRIPEEQPVGTEVLTVVAEDGDVGVRNTISYSLQGGSGYFTIDSKTGRISLLKRIDRDTLDVTYFDLTVTATEVEDPQSFSSTVTSVFIDDINDCSPVFSNNLFNVRVSENLIGRLPLDDISVFDPDLGDSGAYTTVFEADDPSILEHLSMNPADGVGRQNTTYFISIIGDLLDYDDANKRTVSFRLVTRENTGNAQHTATATVVVESYDVNDNTPYFYNAPPQGGYHVEIPEDAVKSKEVIRIDARDKDPTPDFGTPSIRYALQQLDGVNLAINETTGQITVAIDNGFDRERLATLNYVIQITDNYGKGLRNSENLIITVTDINDTPPRFNTQSFPLVASIVENLDPSTVLVSGIEAEDLDLNPNLEISIDWSKTVFTKNKAPVELTDQLKGYFAIEKTSRQSRSTSTAKLVVGPTSPDRETADAAELYVLVKDLNTEKNANSDEVKISITIEDVNDNDPVFDNQTWRMEINENVPTGSFIGTVFAVDIDRDNVITYSMKSCSSGVGLVAIDSRTGRITTKAEIDREVIPLVACTLEATDSGMPPRSSTSTLEVKILDLNDNSPVIMEQPGGPIIIPENSPNNTKIGTVRAADADEGSFGEVKYLFSQYNTEGRDQFSVDLNTGDILISLKNGQTLDFETKKKYVFNVEARDNYNPNFVSGSLSTLVSITVDLTDVNDNAPQLPVVDESSCFASPFELTPKDGLVATFIAEDKDEPTTGNSRIEYSLLKTVNDPGTPSPSVELFLIETEDNKGALRVKPDNLSNKYGNYTVTIMAKDFGQPELNTTRNYKICVQDSNDNKPVFVFPDSDNLRVDVYENNTVNDRLLYITNQGLKDLVLRATDADQNDNGRVSYSFTGDPDGMFYLDRNDGYFVLMKPFDRLVKYRYELLVTASDNGQPPAAVTYKLIIHVRGTSRYDPEFENHSEVLIFKENTLSSQNFTKATDKDNINTDAGDQEDICYFLVGGSRNFKNYFSIPVPKVNSLSLIKELDRESPVDREMYVIIEATNACFGTPPVAVELTSSMTNITFQIEDENDSPPLFPRNFSGGVATGDKKGTRILNLVAEDPDVNDKIKYYLDGKVTPSHPSIQGLQNYFDINPETGETSLGFDVQNTMEGFLSFRVKAIDLMNHEGYTNVKIYIVTQDSKVTFLFNNTVDRVQANRDNIADIFSSVYEYICNIEKIEENTDLVAKASGSNMTTVYSHFVDPATDSPVPSAEIENKKNDFELNKKLKERFLEIGLVLTEVKSLVDPTDPQQQLFFILFIVVCIALVPLIALLFILVVRGSQMNRKIKALTATTFGSQDSGLNRLGAAVPNTNKHTLEGSNPMWNVEDSKQQDGDNVSQSSGDSILIGVEDNPEFRNYNGAAQRSTQQKGGFNQDRSNPYENVTRKNPLAAEDNSSGFRNYEGGNRNLAFESEDQNYVPETGSRKRQAPLPPIENEDSYQNQDSDGENDDYGENELNSNFTFGGSTFASL